MSKIGDLREIYGNLEPLKHDKNPSKSALIKRIMIMDDCHISDAIITFNTLRHWKNPVIVYDKKTKLWQGINLLDEKDFKIKRLEQDIRWLKYHVRKHIALLNTK